MEVIKHNWPEEVDPEAMLCLGFSIHNGCYVYLFEEASINTSPTQVLWEYRADRRAWRKVMFGDGIWNNPYAPKPKGGGCCG